MGGLLFGEGFVTGEKDEGIYQLTLFKSWKIKSKTARKIHQIIIATHIDQAKTVEKWKEELSETVKIAQINQAENFHK